MILDTGCDCAIHYRPFTAMHRCQWGLVCGKTSAAKHIKDRVIMVRVTRQSQHVFGYGTVTKNNGNDIVMPVDAIRDLGVIFDSELSMQQHVNKVTISVCFYHIRRLKQVRRLVGQNVTTTLVSAFVLNRLDYCNAILAGLPKSTTAPCTAARLTEQLASRAHVTTALRELHWLPVQYRITYKLCLHMHLIQTRQAPSCLTDIVTTTAAAVNARARLIRSRSSLHYEKPMTRLRKIRTSSFLVHSSGRIEHLTSAPSTDDEH